MCAENKVQLSQAGSLGYGRCDGHVQFRRLGIPYSDIILKRHIVLLLPKVAQPIQSPADIVNMHLHRHRYEVPVGVGFVLCDRQRAPYEQRARIS